LAGRQRAGIFIGARKAEVQPREARRASTRIFVVGGWWWGGGLCLVSCGGVWEPGGLGESLGRVCVYSIEIS
jgi:hypothetical protein